MESKLNIDHLFAEEESVSKKGNDNIALKKAALLFDFNIEDDFSEIDYEEVRLLQEKAEFNSKGRLFLPNSLRKKILSQLVEKDEIQSLINEFALTNNDYSRILSDVLSNQTLDIENLSSGNLFYLHKLSIIFPEKISNLQVRNIKFELEKRQLLNHFSILTQNFAGRNEKYDELKSYVDWLPQKGVKSAFKSGFRNLINWHDKNPMLITGIGGIGKSTLVSKFILDHVKTNRGNQKLPFIYIDFDLIGFSISEPMNIFIEALRQLSLQFPENRETFKQVSGLIANRIYSKNRVKKGTSKGSRSLILDEIKTILPNYESDLASINMPILVVFDSFEELQYRATSTELIDFFATIKQVSEHLPRVRPVFVGRAKIDKKAVDTEFEDVELKLFDKESAHAILRMYGLKDDYTIARIYNKFGGNPLTLQLAASITLNNDLDTANIKTRGWISRLDEAKIQEQLVKRMLDHIHDKNAKKISMPGMMVRKVNPEIVQNVLAIPCGLGEIDALEATTIYFSLEKEAYLLSRDRNHKEFAFRQDLRLACEPMIMDKYKKEVDEIHDLAIEYYSDKKEKKNQAEYFYHWLKSGKDPEKLTKQLFLDIRIYIENSIHELPGRAQLHINKLISSGVDQKIIDESELIDWESYQSSIVLEAFNGELDRLKDLSLELEKRKERSYTTQLPIVEATLYQRLGDLDKSNKIIDTALQLNFSPNDGIIYFSEAQLIFLKVQNLEYAEKYGQAIELILTLSENEEGAYDDGLMQKVRFAKERLLSRISNQTTKSLISNQKYFGDITEYESILDINWTMLFSSMSSDKDFAFLDSENFALSYELVLNRVHSFKELESFCFDRLNFYFSDLSMPGTFDIAIKDMLYIMEVENKILGQTFSYRSRSGKGSGIIQCEFGIDYIIVEFKNKKKYKYTDDVAGKAEVDEMKKLAVNSHGLASYINLVNPKSVKNKANR